MGVRNTLMNQDFVDFVNKNEHITLDVYLKRGKHPYMTSTYINGFVKDTPLLNKSHDETFEHIKQVNQEFGRKPLRHNHNKVVSHTTSIQGQWENDDKWQNYPKHLLESRNTIPVQWVEPRPLKEIKNKKVKSDYYTKFLRRKFMLNPAYKKEFN